MARGLRKSPWHIERDPARLDFAFFLSHANSESDTPAVAGLKSAVERHRDPGGGPVRSCFLDLDHWENGNDPAAVIREYLLRSEYMVAWITPAYLEASRRGWLWYEFAYAELIEKSLNVGVSTKETRSSSPYSWGSVPKTSNALLLSITGSGSWCTRSRRRRSRTSPAASSSFMDKRSESAA